MPLAAVVDSLDTIPEAARGAYVEKEGKFVLDFDVPDVTGLKKALESERGANKAVKDKIAAWEKLGVSPEDIEQRLEAERKKAEEAALKAGKFDEVLATHLGKAKQEKDAEVGKATKERDAALNVARSAVLNTSLATALTKAKATATGMTALPKLIGDRVKIDFDDAGQAKASIFEADGKTPMVGNGSGGLATFDDLVSEAKKEFSDLFEGSGSGSGKEPNGTRRDAGGKTISRAEFNTLAPPDQALKVRAGFTVVD
jgi:DNA-binding transcriptional MerR regulator